MQSAAVTGQLLKHWTLQNVDKKDNKSTTSCTRITTVFESNLMSWLRMK